MGRFLRLCMVSALVAACAADPPRLEQELDALLGKADKAYFVAKYGRPDKQAVLGEGVDFWEYRFYGRRHTASTGDLFSNIDRVRLTFTRGVLTSWSGAGEQE